jgi:stage II sporulation protein D
MSQSRNVSSPPFIYLILILFIFFSDVEAPAFASEPNLKIAEDYLQRGLYLEAIGVCREIGDQAISPELRASAFLRIGIIYSQCLRDHDSALKAYDKVKKQLPGSPQAYEAIFYSGMAHYEKDQLQKAIQEFRNYLKKHPQGEKREIAHFMIEMCEKSPPHLMKENHGVTLPQQAVIRVLIAENIKELTLCSDTQVTFRNGNGDIIFSTDRGGRTIQLRPQEGAFRINDHDYPYSGIVAEASGDDNLRINGRRYRGKLKIEKGVGNGVSVINVVPLEEYLRSVVPMEMPPGWPAEALKAQAVVSRTYAVYQIEQNRNREYDICATRFSQVYGGMAAEAENTNQAIFETKGKVLTYRGSPVLAYFHSNSGGITEDARSVWMADIPYLRAVRDNYSIDAPNTFWTLFLRFDDIQKALNRNGIHTGPIKSLEPHEISHSGRVNKVRIFHSGGKKIISGHTFRIYLDPSLLKSTLFTMTEVWNGIRFEGKGNGHGVGMSQWGACEMAKAGYPWRDILLHYYQGVKIQEN